MAGNAPDARRSARDEVVRRLEVDPPARRVDAAHPHTHRVAEAERRARPLADEDRALLVELPPVAAQAPDRQQSLVAVAEADERARPDHAGDLAVVHALVAAALVELALEEEAPGDGVRVALDLHRVALARARPLAGLVEGVRPRRGLPRADRAEQCAMGDDVRVAPDRRREVAIARRLQAGVTDVPRCVVRLLERAQDERGESAAAVARAADVLVDEDRALGDDVRCLRRRHHVGHRGSRDVERCELGDEALDGLGLRTLVDAVERRDLALLEQRRDALVGRDHQVLDEAVRLRRRADALALDVAARIEGELGLRALDRQRAARLAPRLQGGCRRPRGSERLRPRRVGRLVAREDPVDAVVVESRVRADHRAVEGAADDLRAAHLHLDRDRVAVDAGA